MDPKTPISLLQEYLVKEGILPTYTLILNGNGTHQPVFQYEVKAKGITATGRGNSKKEAKHEAAKLLLLQLKGKEIWKDETPLILPSTPSVLGNPIGALQEFCVNNSFLYPQYEFVKDEGNLISHLFVVRCTVPPHSAEGRASTKQQAKHLAASEVLKKLQGSEKKVVDVSAYKVIAKESLIAKACDKTIEAFHKSLHDREDTMQSSSSVTKNLLDFAEYFKKKIGPSSSALHSILDMDDESIEKLPHPESKLSSIMSELGYELKYEFLNTKDHDHSLCNLVIKELNINLMGLGKNNNDAKKRAVINSLILLVVMFKS